MSSFFDNIYEKQGYYLLIASISLGLLIRTAFVFSRPIFMQPDSYKYQTTAQSLAAGKGFGKNMFFAPGYPVFMAAIYSIAGAKNPRNIQTAQIILGALTLLLMYKLIVRGFGKNIALSTTIISAVDPFLVYFSAEILSETLFIFLLISSLLLLDISFNKNNLSVAFATGIIIGLGNLTRAIFLGYVLMLTFIYTALLIPVSLRNDSIKKIIITIVIITGIFASMLPWIIRNYKASGKFILVSIQKGWTMYEGLNPDFDNPDAIKTWQAKMAEESNVMDTAKMDAMAKDEYFLNKSKESILSDPFGFSKLAIRKFLKFWRIYPYHPYSFKEKMVSLLFFAPLLIMAVAGFVITLNKWRILLPFYVLILYFSLMAMVFWTQIRYRVPLHPILALFAALGIHHLYQATNRKT